MISENGLCEFADSLLHREAEKKRRVQLASSPPS